MEEVRRIPKLIRAVTNPDEFEPFPLVGDAATFEKCWNENRPWVLANLAHAAYHPHEKIEKLLVAFGAKTIRFHDERACLAVWPDRAVLTFRGTKLDERRSLAPGIPRSIKATLERAFGIRLPDEYRVFLANDLLADLMFLKKAEGQAAVHQGFLGELEKLWDAIHADLETYTGEIPVYATGHSLGGAMATIAGMRQRFQAVVTFGEPRVGIDIESEFRSDSHHRYVNGDDPVTKVPPEWPPFGFRHHGECIALSDPDGPNALYDHSIVYYAQNLR